MSHYAKLATLVLRLAALGLMAAGGLVLLSLLANPASRVGGFALTLFGPSVARIIVGVAVYAGSESLAEVVTRGL